ncbi:MAG: glycoside hydrolase family 3 N-terminal domain-containing protein [Verrucomicrobiota bacterium]
MPTDRELGQLLMTGVPGHELDPDTAARFRALQPGAFILFSRNINKPEQLRKLIDDLRDLSEIEPIITIDQEGGRVSRLREIGHEPPNAQQFRDKNDLKLIKRHGKLTGQLLRLFGFNLDLCPVLDISFDDDADNSLKGRCYGSTPNEVIEKAATFNIALRKTGVLSCGKHFPGYTFAQVDAHHELPVIDRSMDDLESAELLPFRAVLPDCDSVMIGHAWYPCFDPEKRWPSSLSENIITRFLRTQLDYRGLIMTDDLDMGAILNEVGFEETIKTAITAGNDVAMICHRVDMVEDAKSTIASLPEQTIDRALQSIERTKRRLPKPSRFSHETFEDLNNQVWELRVDTLGEEAAHQRSPEDGKRSPVELY